MCVAGLSPEEPRPPDKGWELVGQTELWNLDTPGASHPLADHPTIFHSNLGTERGALVLGRGGHETLRNWALG